MRRFLSGFIGSEGASRALLIALTVLAVTLPKLRHRRGNLGLHPVSGGLIASICPARPRRKSNGVPRAIASQRNSLDDGAAAVDAIRRIARVVRVANHDTQRRVGLTAAQLAVLRSLNTPEALSISDLAQRTMTNASSVSEVVARLVSQGFVNRVRSVRDGRSVELSLTESGRRAVAAALGPDDELRSGMERLADDERKALSQLLGRLLENLTEPAAVEDGPLAAASPLSDVPGESTAT